MKAKEIKYEDVKLLLNVIPEESKIEGADKVGSNKIKIWNGRWNYKSCISIEFDLNQFRYFIDTGLCEREIGSDPRPREITFETFVRNLHRKIESLQTKKETKV